MKGVRAQLGTGSELSKKVQRRKKLEAALLRSPNVLPVAVGKGLWKITDMGRVTFGQCGNVAQPVP